MKNFPLHIKILFLALSVCLLVACTHSNVAEKDTEEKSGVYNSLIEIYRGPLNHLSAVRRGVCPMHPSCSEYSRQAIEKHGFVVGWPMTLDRLMRCGRDEVKHVPQVYVDGMWKYYDPLENNDFWWDKGQAEKKTQ